MTNADSPLLRQFASNLKKLRKSARISQESLALRSGLDRTYISGCERGVRNPTITSVGKIATALNVSVSDLLGVES